MPVLFKARLKMYKKGYSATTRLICSGTSGECREWREWAQCQKCGTSVSSVNACVCVKCNCANELK